MNGLEQLKCGLQSLADMVTYDADPFIRMIAGPDGLYARRCHVTPLKVIIARKLGADELANPLLPVGILM